MKEGTYITIQSWMRSELNLKSNELLLYALIYGFSQDSESVFKGSLNYISEWLGCSRSTTQKLIQSLIDKELIIKNDIFINKVKFCQYKTTGIPKIGTGYTENRYGGVPKIGNNNTNNKDINNNISISWKKNYQIYLQQLRESFDQLMIDRDWLKQQEKYYPNLDVKLTLEKSCVNFWATEAGWINKKHKRIKDINWRSTLTNALANKSNHVYKQREY